MQDCSVAAQRDHKVKRHLPLPDHRLVPETQALGAVRDVLHQPDGVKPVRRPEILVDVHHQRRLSQEQPLRHLLREIHQRVVPSLGDDDHRAEVEVHRRPVQSLGQRPHTVRRLRQVHVRPHRLQALRVRQRVEERRITLGVPCVRLQLVPHTVAHLLLEVVPGAAVAVRDGVHARDNVSVATSISAAIADRDRRS